MLPSDFRGSTPLRDSNFNELVLSFYQDTCGDLRVATMKKYINVSVVIDIECGDTKK